MGRPSPRALLFTNGVFYVSMTAILVDGGFYRKKFEKNLPHTPQEAADALVRYCYRHLKEHHATHELYRIFYYDSPPCRKKIYHPLFHRTIDLGKSEYCSWMDGFIAELTKKRKLALRLGSIDEGSAVFMPTYPVVKDVLAGKRPLDSLEERDFQPTLKQKGVDMKIGVDIASLSIKKQVSQIVLIAGDSDFVPASKLARREGVDFVLDSLGQKVKDELFEHIDGLRSCGDPYAQSREPRR